MRIAVLDIGTNTALLLIAEVEGKSLRILRDDHAIARLGEGVDSGRIILETAYLRLQDILIHHAETIRSLNVDFVRAVGTSVFRDAKNRDEIIKRTKAETGIEIEVLSGEDEAKWGCFGAIFGMSDAENAAVIDIGGGSTEISLVENGDFAGGNSIDIGAVRLTERCLGASPISKEAVENARSMIRESLKKLTFSGKTGDLIAVAGTPTTLAAMDQKLGNFDAKKVQNYVLSKQAIDEILEMLLKTDTATLLQNFPAINKSRADILPGGTLILSESMSYLGVDTVRVSTRGLRYGIAIREIERITGESNITLSE